MSDYNWNQMRQEATTVLTGDFAAVIVKAEATKSSNDKPMIKVQLKITAGQYAGRVIYHNFTVSVESPGAMKMFFAQLATLGLGDAFFAQNPTLTDIATALLGKECTITLESRTYQGVERESIKTFKQGLPGAAGLPTGLPTAAALPLPTAAALPQPVAVSTGAPVLSFEDGEDPF